MPPRMHSTDPLRAANRRGILAMAGGMGCFVVNDTLVKVVSDCLLYTSPSPRD